ncbi:uncharacterized protein [Eurosta solidaginis]|uniref:uncharacterized protein n=1 Tax=Eurosta solidaginis TaxID=178769 RepID=UPI00353063A5
MMLAKMTKFSVCTLLICALLVLSAPSETESRRVIFYAPQRIQIFTSQILSAPVKERPCMKCHMRDHRGICRRVLSYNSKGIKC